MARRQAPLRGRQVVATAQVALATSVIAQAPRLEDGRQADRRNRGLELGARLDGSNGGVGMPSRTNSSFS